MAPNSQRSTLRNFYKALPLDLTQLLRIANVLACLQIIAFAYLVLEFLRKRSRDVLKVFILTLAILLGLFTYTEHRSHPNPTIERFEATLFALLQQGKRIFGQLSARLPKLLF